MIRLDCEQRSSEWYAARLGIPTASRFGLLVTPKTLKPSAQADRYLCQLVAERLLGQPLDTVDDEWLQRGRELEPEAAAWYALTTGLRTEPVGILLTDDRRVGASPDLLVPESPDGPGGVEIKCPSAIVHVQNLLDLDAFADKHRPQVQGCLFVSGFAWWDLVGYNPGLPFIRIRCRPDPAYQAALEHALEVFLEAVDAAEAKARSLDVPTTPEDEIGRGAAIIFGPD